MVQGNPAVCYGVVQVCEQGNRGVVQGNPAVLNGLRQNKVSLKRRVT